MLRGIYGDPERYAKSIGSGSGMYFAGDGAKRDEDGYYWLLGRVDDVMNVAGHRISTTEVESALVDHRSSPRPPCRKGTRSPPGDLRLRDPQGGQEAVRRPRAPAREHVAYVIGRSRGPST